MSRRGQELPARIGPAVTASDLGDVTVEEFPYGLGPPTGVLALLYPPGRAITDFPESRDDFVHQVYWSPDGVLAMHRGAITSFAGPDRALWLRRGAVAEVTALDIQTVVRICLRRAPGELLAHPARVLTMTPAAVDAAQALVRTSTTERAGLAARAALLAEWAQAPADAVAHRSTEQGAAQAVARALATDPSDGTSLAAWAERLHVSTKTLQREFERSYGMPFSVWRTRTRLQASLAMLSRWSVTETAHRVGYASASSFVSAFTREYGVPPGRYESSHAHAS